MATEPEPAPDRVIHKSASSGCLPHPIPMKRAVNHDHIVPSEHELMLLSQSTFHQKRMRRPQPSNPCCVSRQLTDEYELMRLNRNPQLYALTRGEMVRSEQMQFQQIDQLMRSDVSTVKRRILKDAKLLSHRAPPPSVPKGPIDPRIDPSNIPHFEIYTRGISAEVPPPTYGHRPGSAGRIFNPLSGALTKHVEKEPGARQHAPGMTVAQLRGLLTSDPKETHGSQGKDSLERFAEERARQQQEQRMERAARNRDSEAITMEEDMEDDLLSMETPKPDWDNSFGTQKAIFETFGRGGRQAAGTNSWQRDESKEMPFKEKIKKFRKQAAGTLRLNTCEQRQENDERDLALDLLAPKPGPRIDKMAPKSPTADKERREIKRLIQNRKKKEKELKMRVEAHKLLTKAMRIPDPNAGRSHARTVDLFNSLP